MSFLSYLSENRSDIGLRLLEHCWIVGAALLVAVPIGIVLGILLTRGWMRPVRGAVFYVLGLGQTIPSLALLALAVGLLGVGALPAIVALALYSILPIARNTYAGITAVPAGSIDAARGLGMTGMQILKKVELPLATPFIIGGLRIATVVAISGGALASLIGAGGLGDFIFSGISLFQPEAMLAGAIPTALLALAADYLLGRWEGKRRGVV